MSMLADDIHAVISSPLPGVPYIAVRMLHGKISSIDYLQALPSVVAAPDPLARQLAMSLVDYFHGVSSAVSVLEPACGTPFQRRVWALLQQIPAGETRSYGELARQLNSSARAVANACRANPLAILIPCHRVVAANGLGGYMGETDGEPLAIKRWLLHHEGYDCLEP